MQFIDLQKQYSALKKDIDFSIQKVLSDTNFISGAQVKELENELAAYCGTKYCLTCGNGTDALTIALRALNVKKNDAVFVPSFTFFASAETPALEGATCIFVDVDERTFNMDAQKLDKAILQVKQEGKLNLKCVITVDLFGLPANYPEIRKIADKYCMKIIEDGAQGFGGSINGKRACSFGDISTTSFFPAKPLGCYGDGGAIFTDNKNYYDLMCSLAVHGKGSFKYDNVRIGYNSRLDTIQAAILLPKLKAFKEYELEARNIIAQKYTAALQNSFVTPLVPTGFGSSWAQYTLVLAEKADRATLQQKLKDKGIPTMVYYPKPMHKQTVFSDYNFNVRDLNVSESLSERVLSLPMHPYLTDDDIDRIVVTLKSVS